MDEIIAATGGPQYNVIRGLEARGYAVRKVKEGRTTRYLATPPEAPSFDAKVTGKGQVTLPKEIRDHLNLESGQTVRFILESGRVVVERTYKRLDELTGVLPKPRRRVSLEEMKEAMAKGATDRYSRAVGKAR